MKATEYLKDKGINTDWDLTVSKISNGVEYMKDKSYKVSDLMEDYAKEKAIEFMAYRFNKSSLTYTPKEELEKLYQKFKEDES